jgi:hypothetical protein
LKPSDNLSLCFLGGGLISPSFRRLLMWSK